MTDSNEIERIMQVLRDRAGIQPGNNQDSSRENNRENSWDNTKRDSPKSVEINHDVALVTLPDDNIPMLTEVVQVPRYSKAELPKAIDDVQFAALSERVEVNVMERILRHSEQLLDARLKADLESVLQRATETLAADLKTTLSQSIRDMVSHAVSEELTRLQSEITFGKRKE
jgi:hypothetical protein